jgi:ABC-type transporter Mla subunit MlaD
MTTEERFERIESGLAEVVQAQRVNSETLAELVQTVSRFVNSSDARMTRIEQNLDALIRAITAEHSNGKQ